MRAFLLFWLLPLSAFWAWLFLARADAGPGMLSREVYDATFKIYGDMLGMHPDRIPGLIAEAIVLDSMIILAIIGFRRRKQIRAWFAERREGTLFQPSEEESVFIAEETYAGIRRGLPEPRSFGRRNSIIGGPQTGKAI